MTVEMTPVSSSNLSAVGYDPETGEVDREPVEPLRAAPATAGMPPAIAAAIITVKRQVKQLGADDSNKHGGYAFVSVDKFYERIGKLMADAGLALLINEVASDVRASERTDERGATKIVSWLYVQYDLSFMHESGVMSAALHRSCALPISGPQAFGAAQSYIEKQFLRQVFKVPTGEKDADDTPQNEDAPTTRSGGRTAQDRGGQSYPARPQAAPAPSDARAEAQKRYKEIRAEIDAALTIPAPQGLDGIDGSLGWLAMSNAVFAVEEAAKAEQLIEGLRRRIADRRDAIEARAKEEVC